MSLLALALVVPISLAAAGSPDPVLVQATVVRADDPALLDTLVACAADAPAFARAIALAEGHRAVQVLQQPTVLTHADERARIVTAQGESRRVALAIVPHLDGGAVVLDLEAEVTTPMGADLPAESAMRSRLTVREGELAVLRAGPLLVATTAWSVEGPAAVSARLRDTRIDRDDLPVRARARRRALHSACSEPSGRSRGRR